MKVAVTYDNEEVFQHFGHTELFKVYEISDNKIVDKYVAEVVGAGHEALAMVLKNSDIDVLICGGIGMGAQIALNEVGIKFYGGVVGNCDMAVEALLNGTLEYNPDVKCNHHEHHENECGNHEGGCGHHCHN